MPFRANVHVTGSGAPVDDLAAYVEQQLAPLRALNGSVERSREEVALQDGTKAILVHHGCANQSALRVEQLQLYAPRAGEAVVVTSTHLAGETFQKRRDEFRRMLLSVELR